MQPALMRRLTVYDLMTCCIYAKLFTHLSACLVGSSWHTQGNGFPLLGIVAVNTNGLGKKLVFVRCPRSPLERLFAHLYMRAYSSAIKEERSNDAMQTASV